MKFSLTETNTLGLADQEGPEGDLMITNLLGFDVKDKDSRFMFSSVWTCEICGAKCPVESRDCRYCNVPIIYSRMVEE